MTLEELGNLCVDYDLCIAFRPILRGVQIDVHDFQTDEDEYHIVNVQDIESTIKTIIGLEEDSEDAT